MENNNSRDYKNEHKDEKYDYEKMGQFMNYPQMPYNPMYNYPMYNYPMYCPMLKNQPYGPMMPGYSRDDFEDVEDIEDVEDFNEEDEYSDSFRQVGHGRPRRRPYYYHRPHYYYHRPHYYHRPYYYPRPYFFPFFLYDMYDEDEY